MPKDTRTARGRVRSAFRMNQDPIDRLWSIVLVLIVLVVVVGLYLFNIRQYLAEERELGYGRTATDCLELIVDDDRDFDFPNNCLSNEVVVHYPPVVCEEHFQDNNLCGTEWGES